MGIFNAQKNKGTNKLYLRGRGKETKLSSPLAIGNRKGVFYVDSCRTKPNYQNINNIYAERIFVGKPSGIPRSPSNIKTHAYETYRTQRFKAKRKREEKNITLRKTNMNSSRKKRFTSRRIIKLYAM